MTITIPSWLLWVLGGIVGIFVILLAVLGLMFLIHWPGMRGWP